MTNVLSSVHRWATRLLMGMVVVGMAFAAHSAWNWPNRERARTLIVVAPPRASVTLIGGPAPIDDTQGVHTFSLMPGPITLEVRHPELPPQRTDLTIPKGLGGLMVELQFDAEGHLQIGYF
jgi:hypothetical protein